MGRTRRIELCRQNKMDAASRQLLFMSFKGIGKSIRMVRAPTQNADAPAHHSDQFPAGYSLTRCSPAALVSASPAGLDYAAALAQLMGLRGKITKRIALKTNTEKRVRQELGVRGLFVLLSMRITTMLVVSILSDSFPDCLPPGGRILPRES